MPFEKRGEEARVMSRGPEHMPVSARAVAKDRASDLTPASPSGLPANYERSAKAYASHLQDVLKRQGGRIPDLSRVDAMIAVRMRACDYAVIRYGDGVTEPSRIALLARDLEDALGTQLSNSTVTILRYRVFTNQAIKFRALARAAAVASVPSNSGVLMSGLAGGAAGGTTAALGLAGSACTKEEMRGGWFSGDELTAQVSPIIVEIEASWNGKRFPVRTVYTPKQETIFWFSDPKAATAIFEALHQADAALVDAMRVP